MTILSEAMQKRIEAESIRLNHYYLGVEHVFLALLHLPSSLAAQALYELGLSPHYVVYLIEQTLGHSPDRRYWEGFRFTPRYHRVIALASKYSKGDVVTERDLLLALLEEDDNIPVRLLTSLEVDTTALSQRVAAWEAPLPRHTIPIHSDLPLLQAELDLLPDLFPKANALQVENELPTSLSPIRTYIVTAHLPENRLEKTLVTFAPITHSLREKYVYETFVDPLSASVTPPIAAVEALTTHIEQPLGGLKYRLESSNSTPYDLLSYAHQAGLHEVGWNIRKNIYEPLQDLWWQPQERYLFPIWREYELVLPPALVVDAQPVLPTHTLRPLGTWSYTPEIPVGVAVELNDFTILSLNRHQHSLELKAGKGDEAVYYASQVAVNNYPEAPYYSLDRSLHSLTGMVTDTRATILCRLTEQLAPEFDLAAEVIETPFGRMPNPILYLPTLLQYEVEGYLSPIHGALRLENIIVGDHTWLIHFPNARVGHVLFDWAMLEVDLLQKLISPLVSDSWEDLWKIGALLQRINQADPAKAAPDDILARVVNTVTTLREIVRNLLGVRDDWREYYSVLSIMGLASLRLTTAPLGARRLALIAAVLAAHAFQMLQLTASPEAT